MKKINRRSQSKYPALDPKLNLKTRKDLLDYDYLNKLSPKELQFLNDFSSEYINADFKTSIKEGRKRIHRKKRVEHEKNRHLKKLIQDFAFGIKALIKILNDSQITNNARSKLKKSVNKFKKQIKGQIKKEFKFVEDSYKTSAEHSNNHRNMCIMSRTEAQGMLKSTDFLPETLMVKKDTEQEIIDKIDNKGIEDEE